MFFWCCRARGEPGCAERFNAPAGALSGCKKAGSQGSLATAAVSGKEWQVEKCMKSVESLEEGFPCLQSSWQVSRISVSSKILPLFQHLLFLCEFSAGFSFCSVNRSFYFGFYYQMALITDFSKSF